MHTPTQIFLRTKSLGAKGIQAHSHEGIEALKLIQGLQSLKHDLINKKI